MKLRFGMICAAAASLMLVSCAEEPTSASPTPTADTSSQPASPRPTSTPTDPVAEVPSCEDALAAGVDDLAALVVVAVNERNGSLISKCAQPGLARQITSGEVPGPLKGLRPCAVETVDGIYEALICDARDSAGQSVELEFKAGSAGEFLTAIRANVADLISYELTISAQEEIDQLEGAPADFRQFISDTLAALQASSQGCPRGESVSVDALRTDGFAVGGVGGCSGYLAIWARQAGTWGEVASTQDTWLCDQLRAAKIPSAIAGDVCLDQASGSTVAYQQD